jgi:hypothetical protein
MPRLARSTAAAKEGLPSGLTGDEARRRLEKFGPLVSLGRVCNVARA